MRMADPSTPLALPPELHILVDFLAVDCRPTAIFRLPKSPPNTPPSLDIEPEDEPAYLNDAFKRLATPAEELADLRAAIRRSQRSEGVDWHGRTLDGQRWRTTTASQEYLIVALQQAPTTSTAAENQATGLDKREHGSFNGHDSEHRLPADLVSSWNPKSKGPLDWTQHDMPCLSPYVRFIRNFDWASTALGPMSSWSMVLRQYVVTIMANPNPRLIVWGDDMTFVYNAACVPLFGEKHPDALGKHTSFVWAEVWDEIKPLLDATYGGETTTLSALHLPISRNGFMEETYWDCTLLPIFDEYGRSIGISDELTEATTAVTSERRRQRVTSLSQRMSTATNLPDLWTMVLTNLTEAVVDVPFALLYAVVDDVADTGEAESNSTESWSNMNAKCANLIGTVGLYEGHPAAVENFALMEHIETGVGITQGCLKAWKNRESVFLSAPDGSLPSSLASVVPGRSFDEPIKTARVSLIKSPTGNETLAILVTGLNPRCAFAGEYELFLHVTVDFIEKAVAFISLPDEQRKAKKMADDINNALAQQLRIITLKAERSEAKFSRLAASAPTGMFMLSVDGRPLYVNDTYLEMLGHTDHEEYLKAPVSVDWKEQVHDEDFDKFNESWARITQQKVPITIEYRLKRPWKSMDESMQEELHGETWLLATAFPEIEADGSISAIQGWLTDISHRKFSENALSQRLEDAMENKRQTENFIDMTSHEMRNPLSAILQSADSIVSTLTTTGMPMLDEQMTLSAATAEDVIDAAQTIILCAQHQKRIVDDILTLSKLDASLLVISPDKVQPPTLVAKALKMYEADIERAGIDAQLCIEPTYEELGVDWVFLDPSRLLQVIINLLTNSIKFTQYSDVRKIKVCLGASYQKPTGNHHRISFVPPRHNRHPRTPHRGVTRRNDEIYIQCAVYDTGKGLDVEEMKLLFQRFQQASPKTYAQYGGTGLGLFISRELCELQGGQIGVACNNGQTVFAFFVKARRWNPNAEQDMMVSGLSEFSSASASPIAFSRRGSSVLQELTNQMSTHVTENGTTVEDFQPVSGKRSLTPTPNSRVAEENKPAERKQLHVLLVEDNLINQKVVSQQLRRTGCIVHVANHGLECLEFLERSSFCDAESPTPLHLILLDLEMPTMDGLTCIKHIRERQQDGRINSHVPVIAVTANARSEQIATAIEAGMDQVVTKPFRIAELLPTMDAVVSEVKRPTWRLKVNGS